MTGHTSAEAIAAAEKYLPPFAFRIYTLFVKARRPCTQREIEEQYGKFISSAVRTLLEAGVLRRVNEKRPGDKRHARPRRLYVTTDVVLTERVVSRRGGLKAPTTDLRRKVIQLSEQNFTLRRRIALVLQRLGHEDCTHDDLREILEKG